MYGPLYLLPLYNHIKQYFVRLQMFEMLQCMYDSMYVYTEVVLYQKNVAQTRQKINQLNLSTFYSKFLTP